LGSGLAGAKAGILGGIFLAAAIGVFNIALLEAFSPAVLQVLAASPSCSGSAAQGCFSTLLSVSIPTYVMFPVAVLGIMLGGIFGVYYEYLPGLGYRVRAAGVGLGLLIIIFFFGVAGETADPTQKAIMSAFDFGAVIVYSLIIARYYRRFSREVKFESPRPGELKILVDEHDYTGKTRTFTFNSTHKVKASGDDRAFKAWLVSGGVSVDDPRSFETTIKVEGDGLLKVS
jgi:hypothetical protein